MERSSGLEMARFQPTISRRLATRRVPSYATSVPIFSHIFKCKRSLVEQFFLPPLSQNAFVRLTRSTVLSTRSEHLRLTMHFSKIETYCTIWSYILFFLLLAERILVNDVTRVTDTHWKIATSRKKERLLASFLIFYLFIIRALRFRIYNSHSPLACNMRLNRIYAL